MTRDRQQAALDRLRARGNHLAPVMVDGKVRPKGSTQRTLSAAEPALESIGTPSPAPSPQPDFSTPAESAFQIVIEAPDEFLNSNVEPHWAIKAKRVKAWRNAGYLAARRAELPKLLPRVRIDAYVVKPIRNRFDPANWGPTAKAATDGLITDYGLCEDDNRKHVEGPFMHDGGRGEPALRLVVTPLQAKESAA